MGQNAINNKASIMDIDNIRIDGNTISSTDTNGNVVIAPDGSGTVSVTAAPIVPSTDRADSLGSATNSWDNVYADGVTFDDGTNILANFVDSTAWTPVLDFGGGTTGITYGVQSGTYSRIGCVIFYRFHILLTSKGSSAGVVHITGLPTNAATNNGVNIGHFSIITTNTAEYTSIGGTILTGSPTINLTQGAIDGSAVQPLTDGEFGNTTLLITSDLYFV